MQIQLPGMLIRTDKLLSCPLGSRRGYSMARWSLLPMQRKCNAGHRCMHTAHLSDHLDTATLLSHACLFACRGGYLSPDSRLDVVLFTAHVQSSAGLRRHQKFSEKATDKACHHTCHQHSATHTALLKQRSTTDPLSTCSSRAKLRYSYGTAQKASNIENLSTPCLVKLIVMLCPPYASDALDTWDYRVRRTLIL